MFPGEKMMFGMTSIATNIIIDVVVIFSRLFMLVVVVVLLMFFDWEGLKSGIGICGYGDEITCGSESVV